MPIRSKSSNSPGIGRREFLRGSIAATLSLGAAEFTGVGARADDAPAHISRYRKIGKTELSMSDISFGSGSTRDPDLVRHAFDRGVTYFDTAESYPLKTRGLAEDAIGEALQGKRDQVVIASKTSAGPYVRRDVLMNRLHGSLRRLRTDHIDVYFNHAVNNIARLRNPEWFEFVDRAKKQGKIRYSGMSGHGGNLIDCLEVAIREELFDVFLVAHNFGQDPAFYEKLTRNFDIVANQKGLPAVIERAHAKGIGVIAMKTLMGARLNDMRPYEWQGATFAQAAFRWVLSNPHLAGLIVSMRNREQIDEFVRASGTAKVGYRDMRLLDQYARKNSPKYCRIGCGDCQSSCPAGVPISDVLRTRMYAFDYGDQDLASATYRELGAPAEVCRACTTHDCLSACEFGLDVPSLLRETADALGPSRGRES